MYSQRWAQLVRHHYCIRHHMLVVILEINSIREIILVKSDLKNCLKIESENTYTAS